MIPEELASCIEKARAEGKAPFFVNATSGSTVLGAYDDLSALAEVCKSQKIWLHVDACWGGSVVFSPRLRHLMRGSELVDSIAWNPHKMVGAPLQTSAFIVRHKGLLHQTNSANATYLFQQDKFYDVSYDTGDKSVQCGRKTDAFKIWFMMRVRGEAWLADSVKRAHDMSRLMEAKVEKHPNFKMVLEPSCTNINFVYVPPCLKDLEGNKSLNHPTQLTSVSSSVYIL